MEQLRIGIAGLGFGLHYMSRLMQTPRGRTLLDVRAVCDGNSERLAQGQKEFNCRGFADLEQMLEDPEIDAVGLFSGPVGRAGIVRQILRAGKHVMTTKPFELDPQAAVEVLREAKAQGKIVALNSPAATTPDDIRQIMIWQREYNLGKPLAAHWQTWASYREKPDGTWYDDPKLCPVAPIFRLGIYAINDILYFLKDPEEVHVMHSRLFTQRPTPDHAVLSIRFKDGALATVFATFCVDTGLSYPDRLTLNFERGTVFRNVSPRSSRHEINLELTARGKDGGPTFAQATGFDPEQCGGHSAYQWEVFIAAIRGEPLPTLTPPEQIADGVRVIAAMAKSEQSGKPEVL